MQGTKSTTGISAGPFVLAAIGSTGSWDTKAVDGYFGSGSGTSTAGPWIDLTKLLVVITNAYTAAKLFADELVDSLPSGANLLCGSAPANHECATFQAKNPNVSYATDVTSWPELKGQDLGTIKDLLKEDGYVNYPRNPGAAGSDVWYDPSSGSRIRIDENGDSGTSTPHLHKEKVDSGLTSKSKIKGAPNARYDDQGNQVDSNDPNWVDKVHIPIEP